MTEPIRPALQELYDAMTRIAEDAKTKGVCAIRHRGDSPEMNIRDGDILVWRMLEETDELPADGSIVSIIPYHKGLPTTDKALIRKMYRDENDTGVVLWTENALYAPLYYPHGEYKMTARLLNIIRHI